MLVSPKTKTTLAPIGGGAGNFLGVRRIFAQIFTNVLEKKQKNDLKNKQIAIHWTQSTSTTIFVPKFSMFAQISPNLPKNNKIQTWR